jgi:hypothetical protein
MNTAAKIVELLTGGPRRKESFADEKRARKEAADRIKRDRDMAGLTDHRGGPATRAPEQPDQPQSVSAGLRGELEQNWRDWDGR